MLGKPVDLVTEKALKPQLRDRILSEVIYQWWKDHLDFLLKILFWGAIMIKQEFIYQCKNFIEKIDAKYPIKLAYLFGSRATGTENLMSDVDIAIIFKNSYSNMDRVMARGDIIEEGKAFFKLNVDVISLDNASITLKHEVIKNGIIIKDTTDAARAEFESITLREYFDFKYYSDIYNESMIKNIKSGKYFGG